MRGLERHEGILLEYARGTRTFGEVEQVVHNDVRVYASRRAARWTSCPALEDDVAQVLLVTLWQSLDAYDLEGTTPITVHCGARMEHAVKRLIRSTVARDASSVYVVDEETESADPHTHALVELLHDLRTVNDEGVRAYALAALDAGGRDVVTRLASDAEAIARLGWSDVVRDSNAARRRAQRNRQLIEALGGMA